MFDVALTFMLQFVEFIPFIICFILIFNLIAFLLWGGR